MKYQLFIFILVLFGSCSSGDSMHQPETPAAFSLKLKVETAEGGSINEVKNLLRQFIEDKGIVYQSIELDEANGMFNLGLIEFPEGYSFPQFQADISSVGHLGFSMMYKATDKSIVSLFETLPKDSLARLGFLFYGQNPNMQIPSILGSARPIHLKGVQSLFSDSTFINLLPLDIKLLWSFGTDEHLTQREPMYNLYGIKVRPGWPYFITGKDVAELEVQRDEYIDQSYVIYLTFNEEGTEKWGKMTTDAYHQGEASIAVIFNEKVVFAPRVINPILGGRASIMGGLSKEEATAMAHQIRLEKHVANIEVISSKTLKSHTNE